MHPRHNVTERFSTFLLFEADQASKWTPDPQLSRSMQICLVQLPQSDSEDFMVAYWYGP